MLIEQVGVGVESDRTESQPSDILKNFVDVAPNGRLSAGNVDTGRGAAQNLEYFNGPGRVQPLLGNVRVHVARPVIAIGAAKITLHRDVKPGDHRLDEFLVRAAAIARVQYVGEKSVDELIGNSAHRILFGYPGWGPS